MEKAFADRVRGELERRAARIKELEDAVAMYGRLNEATASLPPAGTCSQGMMAKPPTESVETMTPPEWGFGVLCKKVDVGTLAKPEMYDAYTQDQGGGMDSNERGAICSSCHYKQRFEGQLAAALSLVPKIGSRSARRLMELCRKVEAPVGLVALVFTDVQNSTYLWNQEPEAMRKALSMHNHIFRSLLPAYDGYEVKTEGDAFMLTFHDVPAAVKFSLAVQEQLLRAEWPEEILVYEGDADEVHATDGALVWRGLRVRMGIHFGGPLCERDPLTGRMDYFGPVVNRAARVSSKGHGGEIVYSSEVSADVDAWLLTPDGKEHSPIVAKVGMMNLKGFDHAVEIFQMFPESLALRRMDLSALWNASGAQEHDESTSTEEEPREKTLFAPYMKHIPSVMPSETDTLAIVFVEVDHVKEMWDGMVKEQDIMIRALDIYTNSIRSELRKFGGYEVMARGDVFMVSFTTSRAAVQWCLQVQLQLATSSWPTSLIQSMQRLQVTPLQDPPSPSIGADVWRGVQVKMGVNRSEPNYGVNGIIFRQQTESDGVGAQVQYFGPAVYRTAKLCTLAHGGEILCTKGVSVEIEGTRKNLVHKQSVEITSQGKWTLWEDYKEEVFRLNIECLRPRSKQWALLERNTAQPKIRLELTPEQRAKIQDRKKHEQKGWAQSVFMKRFKHCNGSQKTVAAALEAAECEFMELEDEYAKSHFDPLKSVSRAAVELHLHRCRSLALSVRKADLNETWRTLPFGNWGGHRALHQPAPTKRAKKSKKIEERRWLTQEPVSIEDLWCLHSKLKRFDALVEDYIRGSGDSASNSQLLAECNEKTWTGRSMQIQQTMRVYSHQQTGEVKAMLNKVMQDIITDESVFNSRNPEKGPLLRRSILGLFVRLLSRIQAMKHRESRRSSGSRTTDSKLSVSLGALPVTDSQRRLSMSLYDHGCLSPVMRSCESSPQPPGSPSPSHGHKHGQHRQVPQAESFKNESSPRSSPDSDYMRQLSEFKLVMTKSPGLSPSIGMSESLDQIQMLPIIAETGKPRHESIAGPPFHRARSHTGRRSTYDHSSEMRAGASAPDMHTRIQAADWQQIKDM